MPEPEPLARLAIERQYGIFENSELVAADIIEDLQTALDEISLIYADLTGTPETP